MVGDEVGAAGFGGESEGFLGPGHACWLRSCGCDGRGIDGLWG